MTDPTTVKTLLLIDAESLIFQIAYRFREEDYDINDIWIVQNEINSSIKEILTKSKADFYMGFLGSSNDTFRHSLALTKPYKGNRAEKPDWYLKWSPIIIKHLRVRFKFEVVVGIEVDDIVSIIATKEKQISQYIPIVGGIDKDLKQISGVHFNLSTFEYSNISAEEAEMYLWEQVLKGDSSDNILGIPGVGNKKAKTILEEHEPEKYPYVVLASYIKHYGERVGVLKYSETCNLAMLLTEGTYKLNPQKNEYLEVSAK